MPLELLRGPLAGSNRGMPIIVTAGDGKVFAAGYSVPDLEPDVRSGILLWDVDLESWQRRAGLIANRNFTREEWRDCFPDTDTPYRKTFPDLPDPPEPKPK
jgi:hypothetical protein